MASPDWNVSMAGTHLRKFQWVYCLGHAGVKGNDRADRPAVKATISSGLRLGRSEVLRNLRHYLRAYCQGHHTIDRLAWGRKVLKEETFDDLLSKTKEGHRQSDRF